MRFKFNSFRKFRSGSIRNAFENCAEPSFFIWFIYSHFHDLHTIMDWWPAVAFSSNFNLSFDRNGFPKYCWIYQIKSDRNIEIEQGLYLFERGSAQFAGGFIISISSITPGGFYLASFAMMGFLRRVLNFITETWTDFWYKNKKWLRRIFVVIPKSGFT